MQWDIRAGLKYTRSHEWMSREGSTVTVGLTDYAQDMLKDIVFVELPAAGRTVTAGESFALVESVKAITDCCSPVDGVVVAVNEGLLEQPELLNRNPYGEGWIAKIEVAAGYENPTLMDEEEYTAFVREESAR